MESEATPSKSEVIEKYRIHPKDSGSPEVQVAALTRRLQILTSHFDKHPQDEHSKRGLMSVVSRRKRLLNYLRREDVNRYRSIISSLGIRK